MIQLAILFGIIAPDFLDSITSPDKTQATIRNYFGMDRALGRTKQQKCKRRCRKKGSKEEEKKEASIAGLSIQHQQANGVGIITTVVNTVCGTASVPS